jgi:hypothetical protein
MCDFVHRRIVAVAARDPMRRPTDLLFDDLQPPILA